MKISTFNHLKGSVRTGRKLLLGLSVVSAVLASAVQAQECCRPRSTVDATRTDRLIGKPPKADGLDCPAGQVFSGGSCVTLPTPAIGSWHGDLVAKGARCSAPSCTYSNTSTNTMTVSIIASGCDWGSASIAINGITVTATGGGRFNGQRSIAAQVPPGAIYTVTYNTGDCGISPQWFEYY